MNILEGWNSGIIDWDKYKITLDKDSSVNFYIDFCIKVFEVGGILVGDYCGTNTKTELIIGNIEISIRPDDFCRSVYGSLLKFKEALRESGDKLIEYVGYKRRGIVVKIRKKSGEVEEVAISTYNNSKYHELLSTMDRNQHPAWKGGITPVAMHLRGFIKRSQWQIDSFVRYNSRCVISGKPNTYKDKLHIHHLHAFSDIVRETMAELNLDFREQIGMYSDEELDAIEEKCLGLHYKYGLGVTISESLHYEFHSIYGKGGNTPEQFEEFKKKKLKNKI